MDIQSFYKYHANQGGKLLAVWIAGKLENLTLGQFKTLTCTFTLTSSETAYIIKNGVISVKK